MRLKALAAGTAIGLIWARSVTVAAPVDTPPLAAETATVATHVAPVVAPVARAPSDEVHHQIDQAIFNMRTLRDKYAKEILRKRDEQTWFDSPIIGLGIASVAAALFRASPPAIGSVGLVSGGLSQYRSYYNPEGVGAAYVRAVKAARCVASDAEPLMTVQPEDLWTAIASLRVAMAQVSATAAMLDPSTQEGKDGADAASKAMTAANSALAALTAEASATTMRRR
jgi:hypothetical protein